MFNYIDNSTEIYLRPAIDYLKSRLSNEAKAAIADANCTLLFSIAPGSIHNVHGQITNHLIVIDKTLTQDVLGFDPTEIAAEILHELGHILREPAGTTGAEKEYYADDFARMNRLSIQLGSGIKKYIKTIKSCTEEESQRYFFSGKNKQEGILNLFESRLQRITEGVPLLPIP